MKDRIQKLLGSGLSPALVATVVGCDPSYISQLLADSSFALSVAEMRITDIEELRERDGKYDRLEDAFLDKLENLLPMMLRPRDILSALQVINAAKRRAAALLSPISSAPSTINNIVVLQLPAKTLTSFERNSKNEIISIDSQALVAMPTTSLLKEISSSAETKEGDSSPKGDTKHDHSPPPAQNISSPDGETKRLSFTGEVLQRIASSSN